MEVSDYFRSASGTRNVRFRKHESKRFPRLFRIQFPRCSSQVYLRIFNNLTRVSPGDSHQVRPFPWPIRCVASTHLQFRGSHSPVADPSVLCSYKTARLSSKQRILPNQLADWSGRLPRPVGTLGGPARWFLAPGSVFIRTQQGQILVVGCRWNLQ